MHYLTSQIFAQILAKLRKLVGGMNLELNIELAPQSPKVNVQKEEIHSLNYNVKRFGEPTGQKVYALVTHTAFCQHRRTETNTTAQRQVLQLETNSIM